MSGGVRRRADRLRILRVGPVGRTSLLSLVALIVIGGTRIFYGLIISRVTDLETFGQIGVLIATTMISSYLLPSGIGAATSQFVPYSRGRGDLSVARGHYRDLGRAAVLAAVGLAILSGVGVVVVLRVSAAEALEVALLTIVYSLYTTDKAALYAFGRVRGYLGIEVVGSALVVAATIGIAVTGGPWYLAPFIIGYGAFVIGARILIWLEAHGEAKPPTHSDRRSMLGYALLAGIGIVASAGFLQATQLLAARFAAPNEVAYFAAAVTLVVPMYFLPRAMSLALFPFMSEAHGAGQVATVRRHADLATRAMLALLGPVFVLAELLAPEAMYIFGGSDYVAGAPVLRLILAAVFVSIVGVASVNALSSDSVAQLRTTVKWSVTGCVAGLAVVAVLGGPLGAFGVGIAYLVGTAITASGPLGAVWRRYDMAWAGPVSRGVLTVGGAAVLAELGQVILADSASSWPVHVAAAALGLGIALLVLRGDIVFVLTRGIQGLEDSSADPPPPSSAVPGTSLPASREL